MGKNMTSGARRLSGNAVTLLITALLCGGSAALIYSGAASRQISNMLISMACYIVMAVSLNLVVGLLGELSLGHAGFMSVGLFTGCLLSIQLAQSVPIGVRMPLSMLLGGVVAAVVGLLVGLPALRLKGDYLAIVTLACGEIIKTIINNLSVTGGAKGLDTSEIYADTRTLLPFAIVLIFLVVLVMMNLKNSRHGRAIMAIRDNRIAAESNGVNVTYYKLMVFVLAAFFAGMAGVLYGHTLANIKPAMFDYNMSIEILVIVELGGVYIDGITIATMAVTAIIMVGLSLFISRTRMGKAMRAVSEDKEAAELMGISVNRTITVTFAIGSALAGVAAIFYGAAYTYIRPTTGAMPGIKAFTAAVFGGIGSIPGAMLGGVLLGVIEQLSKTYISTLWADAIVFGVLVAVLVVKPTGLLGKRISEKV